MRLNGKVALVTGGARGLGEAIARLFAHEGARVVIGDILATEGGQVESEITQAGGKARFVRLDVTREADWQQAIDTAVSSYGNLNVLVNAAGIIRQTVEEGVHRPMRVEEMSPEVWERIMEVNAKGPYLGARLAVPEMRKAGGGSIVNIVSASALAGLPSSPAYGASKGAVRVFTRAIAIEYGRDGIRANSIFPGTVPTGINRDSLANDQVREAAIRKIPLSRLGRPEDIAYGALYLASDESGFVTGAELVIDGGTTAQ